MSLLSPLQPARSTGKASPPCCSWEPPTKPQGQVTFKTAQAQINSAGLQDNRLLESREKCAICNFCHQNWEYIWSESLRQIPSPLCISASPSAQLCKVWHARVKGTAEMQKVTEQHGKTGARHNRLRFSEDGYLFILTLFQERWEALTVIKVQRLPTEYFL